MPEAAPRQRLNLRVPTPLYAAVCRAAVQAGLSLNDWCAQALTRALEDPPP